MRHARVFSSIKDPTAKEFVRSDLAIGAGWKILHTFMASHSASDCRNAIERYVDGDDRGLTRRSMRFACGLPVQPNRRGDVDEVRPPPQDPVEAERQEMKTNSDTLIKYCLDNDLEYMTLAQCRLASCIPGNNHAARKDTFQTWVSNGLWKQSVKGKTTALANYIPMVRCTHGLSSLFPPTPADLTTQFREEHHYGNLRKYILDCPGRKHNTSVFIKYYEAIEVTHRPRTAGRTSDADQQAITDAYRSKRKLQDREQCATRLLDQFAQRPAADENDVVELLVQYRTKYGGRSRRMVVDVGLAGMSRAMQAISAPDIAEWDHEKAAFSICSQIPARLDVQLDHEAVHCTNMRKYITDPDGVLDTISLDSGQAKSLCHGVFHGMRIPVPLQDNVFLQGLRKEGRLMRWIASSIQPAFHTRLIDEGVKSWPENTAMHYMWTGVEDWVTEVMSKFTLGQGSCKHLSLHSDAIKVHPSVYGYASDAFKEGVVAGVLERTGLHPTPSTPPPAL
jgi:hypothetical protein